MVVELKTVVPFGRSQEEYRMIFDLKDGDLEKNIVGVGDGVSSFNIEMKELGHRVTSVDPIYEEKGESIEKAFYGSIDNVVQQLGATHDDYLWGYYINLEVYRQKRVDVIERFLKDFERGKDEGRYVLGELPNLNYPDGSFDLALNAHLLFLYSELFSYEFHLASIKEMARIAHELRIYPLMDISTKRSWHVGPLVAELEKDGYAVEIRKIGYEFMKGSNEVMIVKSQLW